MMVGGRYLDHMTRGQDGWAIAHRNTTVEWSGELPELTTGPLSQFLTGTWDQDDISYHAPHRPLRTAAP